MAITGRDAVALSKVADQVAAVAKRGERPLEIVADLLDNSTPKKLIEETVAKFGKLDVLVSHIFTFLGHVFKHTKHQLSVTRSTTPVAAAQTVV